jgi:hypothetical protein
MPAQSHASDVSTCAARWFGPPLLARRLCAAILAIMSTAGTAPSPWARRLAWVACGCAAAAAIWLAQRPEPAAAPSGRDAIAAAGPATAASTHAVATPMQGLGDPALPPGVSPDQWRQLQAEMRDRPDGAAELARIAEYLHWSDLVQRLRVPITDDAERLRLARAIDAGLEARLRAGEVSAAEARQVKAATLEVTQVDAAARAAELQRWSVALATPARPDPRQAEFQRRQAATVAAWSAQAPDKRDPAALERELDALRREVFGAPPASRRAPRSSVPKESTR